MKHSEHFPREPQLGLLRDELEILVEVVGPPIGRIQAVFGHVIPNAADVVSCQWIHRILNIYLACLPRKKADKLQFVDFFESRFAQHWLIAH
ncbi:MAG: hypothetical protein EBT99_10420 [Betaproteobacteria bacterium]|jgi:hypothetical protein|nr:hypothetical protein [Betaproteobacteria bacterium]NBY53939.1 hypothetical protein [Betaproteobacteria bacterium]NCY08638.1 hypothetical protein [Betaproteobacteria bacterium]NDD14357.1 hypothetical protein [Betaproteobacteria bacterium]